MKKIFVMLLVAVLAIGVSFDASAKGKAAKRGKAATTKTIKLDPSKKYLLTQIVRGGDGMWIEIDGMLNGHFVATVYTPDGEDGKYNGYYNPTINWINFSPCPGTLYSLGTFEDGKISGNIVTFKNGARYRIKAIGNKTQR